MPRSPSLVAAILDEAFPPRRSASEIAAILDEVFPARKADGSMASVDGADVVALDPYETLSFGGRRAPRWLVETLL